MTRRHLSRLPGASSPGDIESWCLLAGGRETHKKFERGIVMKKKRVICMAVMMAAAMALSGCAGTGGSQKADDKAAASDGGQTGVTGNGEASQAAGEGSRAEEKDSGKKAEQTAQKPVEITFPTFLAGENVGAVFFVPQVERFNKKYEGTYKITIEEVPQAQYAEKIKQLAQQKKLPVIVHSPGSGGIDDQWFKNVVVANGLAYDLTGFSKENPDVRANWIDDSVNYCTVNGKLICKPSSVLKPVGLYYNRSLYQPGKAIRDMTMDEFINSLGDNKIAFQTSENAWTTGLLLTALVANQKDGADYLAGYADSKLYDYTDPRMVAAVTELQKLLQKKASANAIGAAYADAANSFMSGKAAVICNGSWMAADFEQASSDKWSGGFTGDQVNADIYPGNVAIANPKAYGEFWIANTATDEEKKLAEAFFAFRDSKEEIEALVLAEGGVAPKLDYSQDFLKKQSENRILAQLADSMNENTKYTASIFDVMPASVADTEFGKLLPKLADGTLSPEQFCQQLSKKAEEAKS